MGNGPQPPTLASGRPMLERILVYGGPDAGKTRALLSIAKWHQKLGSDATFHVLVTPGNSYDRSLSPQGDFGNLTNITIYDVGDMRDYIDAARKARSSMRAHDWFSIDLMSSAWPAAQDEFAEHKWGSDLADYWMTKAVDADGSPIDGWDWGVINKRYRSLVNNEIARMPGHVLCMSAEAGLREASRTGKGGESQRYQEWFGRIGYKPAGQKEDAHRYDTVIRMSQVRAGKWVAVQARDREREWESFDVGDFFKDYLRGIAGWSLT